MKENQQIGKKFYFFEYFYILLKSASLHSNRTDLFESFKVLKQKFLLGESKYKKLTVEEEKLTKGKLARYEYTFNEVISETANYNLIKVDGNKILITELGIEALKRFASNKAQFNLFIFRLIEKKHYIFRRTIEQCYNANKSKGGLLIFPIYSPRKLGFEKSKMIYNVNLLRYSQRLREQLENDIQKYVGISKNLKEEESKLINKLREDSFLIGDAKAKFDLSRYNAITSRFRKHWLNYFLKEVYKLNFSFTTFNIWLERGKQLGVIHTTEFHPSIDGRIVYPTSIIKNDISNKTDFQSIFKYPDDKQLWIHKPSWDFNSNGKFENQENFVKALVHSYYDLRKSKRTHFVRLTDLREKVCYKLKVSNFIFDDFIEKTYLSNIKGEMGLKVQISLEADRLPQETNAMYLKREPILINGSYKNIISINYQKQ